MVSDSLRAWPPVVPNVINGASVPAAEGATFTKRSPATGAPLAEVARSQRPDADAAIAAARRAQPAWAARTVVERGDLLRAIAQRLLDRRVIVAGIVHAETGKAMRDALGEAAAAAEMGFFVAGEGRRYYGHTTTSAVPHKTAMTVRQPLGVAALIIAGNTPIANVAWKVFPALLCGNTAVLKASEDTPLSAWYFGQLAEEVGLPPGVLNIVHGFGREAGAPLVESPDVDVISFTGSTAVGRWIQETAGPRLAKICLELGGKNAFVVCDDADLDVAVKWALLSAFSNAGQRCAAGSRLLVFDAIYEEFRDRLVRAATQLRVGTQDSDDFGPVINEAYLTRMLGAVDAAVARGARLLTGGHRLADPEHASGWFLGPTLLEGAPVDDPISRTELFGPISCLYRVDGFERAVAIANDSPYGLTAAIHTTNIHRGLLFADRIQTGVVTVNGGTFGSEPHLPFGGLKASGTGFREAGSEALDVYSEWKTVYVLLDPSKT